MEALWEQHCACIREVIRSSGIDPAQVAGMAVCGHGKGLYCWGKDNAPACHGIASTDLRARAYPKRWKESGVHAALFPQLCQDLIPSRPPSWPG